jgi:hypothetical protein
MSGTVGPVVMTTIQRLAAPYSIKEHPVNLRHIRLPAHNLLK